MYFLLIFLTYISFGLARNVGLEGDLYEGDIALKTSLPSNSSSSLKLAAIRDASKIWPGGKVPYRIDKDSIPNEDNQHMIREVMSSLSQEIGCIEFQDNEQVQKFDSVRIAGDGDKDHSSTGCWSYVGLQGGEQTLNLGSGCFSEEIIYHEILHLLGIIHEQNRPDRDDFVEIIWSNIEPGKKGQFEKRNESEVKMQDTPYDFRSRMHYTADSFSKSDAPTILARYPGNDNFGPLNKLSPTDIVEISLLYQCDIDSRTVVQYTHANRYANEVRIEQVWDEIEAVNTTIEDKLEEMDTKLTYKNDKMEKQINELIELFNTRNSEIEQLKEKTKVFEEENKKITKLNNQQKGLISKMEKELVYVNGILTMQLINGVSLECSGSKTVKYPTNLNSPNFPGRYPANVDCSFTLIPRPGKSVHLEFTYFSVHCSDYVEMDPPINGKSKFCGWSLSKPPTTTFDVNQQVTLRFHTNGSSQDSGWNAIFSIV